jgi:hypothetical protein
MTVDTERIASRLSLSLGFSPLLRSNSSPEDAFETFQNMKNTGVGQGSKDFYLRLARMYLKNGA